MKFPEIAAIAINENEFFTLCEAFDHEAIQLLWDLSNGLYAEYFIQKAQENLEVYILHSEYVIQKLTFFNVDEACDGDIWF